MGLVLASGSPRRRMLLEAAGIAIMAVRPPQIPEQAMSNEPALAFARRIARDKALATVDPSHLVLAADTIVHLGAEIFGKPDDDTHARFMLRRLSGRWHQVTTAWALHPPGGPVRVRHATSRVRFRELSPADIDRYLETRESRDKAGSYAIQGHGIALVSRVVGSYTNVVGLPLEPVLSDLANLGLPPR